MFLTPLTPTPEAALRDVHATRAEFRVAAARALGNVPAEHLAAALEGLRTLCRDTDARVRLEALAALGLVGDATVLPDVLAQRQDPAPAVRATALLTAGALGCDEAVLVESVTRADPPLQIAGLEALAQRVAGESGARGDAPEPCHSATSGARQASPTALHATLRALDDVSEAVRATAAAALAALDARSATDALAGRLTDVPRVRASAALALADLGDSRGVPVLIEQLARGSFEAAEALGTLGVDAAREPLAASAGRLFTPLLTKAAAGAALIRLGDPRGEDALRAVLKAFRPDGRPYAVTQVMQLKLSGLRPELEALVKRPRGVDLDLLRDALSALGTGSPA
ncbi:MAG: HEAT repeat domain-containing protein [Sandaracinaceae bacterium]|nr:HEAT repeat domain-containing protein [Sandaracinaceae bacterium]